MVAYSLYGVYFSYLYVLAKLESALNDYFALTDGLQNASKEKSVVYTCQEPTVGFHDGRADRALFKLKCSKKR